MLWFSDKIFLVEKMEKVWVNRAHSFEEAAKFDESYYKSMSPQERLDTVQFLREIFPKIKKDLKGEDRKRFRRIVRIIKQK